MDIAHAAAGSSFEGFGQAAFDSVEYTDESFRHEEDNEDKHGAHDDQPVVRETPESCNS